MNDHELYPLLASACKKLILNGPAKSRSENSEIAGQVARRVADECFSGKLAKEAELKTAVRHAGSTTERGSNEKKQKKP